MGVKKRLASNDTVNGRELETHGVVAHLHFHDCFVNVSQKNIDWTRLTTAINGNDIVQWKSNIPLEHCMLLIGI